jgi:4-amino-4-deoxy-L-arabinose transferase-like glycosyltransferase
VSENLRYQLWVVAAASVIFFTNLGGAALWDMDEALYTTCAREMFQRGDWVVPMFNGQMFPEKPPLMFWTMMAGFEIFGVNEFGARFFSAVFGVATALAAFHLGRILFNARVALWAGLITASTIIFTVSARAATVDSALTLTTTLAFLLFFIARRRETTWPALALMYACIGVAVLAKGPVGMVLPLAAMGFYLLLADGWRNVLRAAWWMRPFTAIIIVAAVALPWYVWVGFRTDGEWLRTFIVEYNLRPFKQPILGHGDASSLDRTLDALISISYYFYHIPAILVGFFPWAVFLGPTLVDTIRRIREKKGDRPIFVDHRCAAVPAKMGTVPPFSADGCLLASCWFGVWLVFWSVCKTKLPHYLLPAYPALALLTACFVDRWQTEPANIGRWHLRNAWLSMILVGVGIMIAIPIAAAIYLPGEAVLGLVGLIPLLGGAWCWWHTAHDRHRQAAIGFAVAAVVFLTAMFGFAALRVDRHQNAKPIIACIFADSGIQKASGRSAPPIATYCFFRESMVYYAGYPVTRCENDQRTGRSARQELQTFLTKPKPSYVITTDEHAPEIEKAFPAQFHVIFHQRCFGDPNKCREVLVLRAGPKPEKETAEKRD